MGRVPTLSKMNNQTFNRRLFLAGSASALPALEWGLPAFAGASEDTSNTPLSQERLSSLERALERMDSRYDPDEKMVTSTISKVGYHTTLKAGTVHPTRTSLTYAVALLDSGDDKRLDRARAILDRVIDLQDQNPDSRTYGIWSWYYEEPLDKMSPPDWNWADFCGVQLLAAWVDHRHRLDKELVEKIRTSIIHAAESIKRRNVGLGYTNIAIMGTYVTLITGEQLKVDHIHDYAKDRLKRLHKHILDQGSFNEYNSPTYTIVALAELSRMLMHVQDQDDIELINDIHDLAWKHAAVRFHPPTGQWAGPHSRCYATNFKDREGYRAFLEAATGNQGLIIKEDPLPLGIEHCRLQINCPDKYVSYYAKLKPRTVTETFIQGDPKPTIGSTYLHPQYTLGTVNHADLWNQRRPLVAYWGTQDKPAYMRIRFLHDHYDYSSAIPFICHSQCQALCTICFATNYGDTHISLDKVKNATIKASDLRLRFEFGGSIDALRIRTPSSPNDAYILSDRNIQLRIKPLGNQFDKSNFQWESGSDVNNTWIDAIAWQGEEKAINFTTLEKAYFAFAIQIASKNDPTISIKNAEAKIKEDIISTSWSFGNHRLELSCPTQAKTLNTLREQFQSQII